MTTATRPTPVPSCPRCKSNNTGRIRNFGRFVPGRFECFACRRWFGPNNPHDAGGTGTPSPSGAGSATRGTRG